MNSKISARMKASAQDCGAPDSLRNIILSHISGDNYQRAVEDLKSYLDSKDDYPQFKARSERYISYAVDLVNAIKAKRSFPGMQQLSMSKQQELFDRAMEHFEDLKVTLRKVEQIESEVRLEDVRSTVWVVKALIYCLFAFLTVAFVREASKGVLPAAAVVADSASDDIVNFLFDKLGL
ncbi:MAG TPA: hypothetical protein VM432_01870 [Bdellovibrionales bacterium]|nr:hypothetical protein [Bdellovibrionales bacterium]